MIKIISLSKNVFILMLVCFETILVSCQDKIIRKELERKNPVFYTIKIGKDSLCNVISKNLKINNMMVWDALHGNMVLDKISDLFLQPNNKSDFCLMPISYICKSRIYQKQNGDSLEYEAWFYLHTESIDKINTKISITTIEPKIIVGRELLPKPPHFVRKDKTLTVEPSTIEEYEILLEIGRLVSEKDMPPLNIP